MSEHPLSNATPPKPWYVRAFLTGIVAILLGMVAQRLLELQDDALLLHGLALYALAGLIFLAAAFMASPFAPRRRSLPWDALRRFDWRLIEWWRVLLGIAAAVLLFNVLRELAAVPRVPQLESYNAIVMRWLLSIALVFLAFATLPARRPRVGALGRFLVMHRVEALTLAGIVAIGAILRIWNLAQLPATLSGDEASIGYEAVRILNGDIRDPFGLMWGPIPAMTGFGVAGLFQLFGENTFALRLPSAIFGTLAVPALYLLARRVSTRETALIAALLLAVMPLHIHYSRIGVNNIADTFFFTASLGLFWWGIRTPGRSLHFFLLAGLLGGFGQYVYLGSRLLLAVLASMVGYLFLFHRSSLKGKWLGIIGMTAMIISIASPLYLHAYRYPDDFNARFNQTGIIQTGWLAQTAELTGRSVLPVLLEQFRLAFFGFAFTTDNSQLWGSSTPWLPPLFSLAFYLGLFLSLREWRKPEVAMFYLWFWSVIIAGNVLSTTPPYSSRALTAIPLVAILAALGWQWASEALTPAGDSPPNRARLAGLLLVLLTLGTGVTSILNYRTYLSDNQYGGPDAIAATYIGRELQQYPASETTFIFLGAPRMFADISPIQFLAPGFTAKEYREVVTAFPADLPAGDLIIIVLPERFPELSLFGDRLPQGEIKPVYDPATENLLFYTMYVER